MDFFKMMAFVSWLDGRGKGAWRWVERWLRNHPYYPFLPGGIELAGMVDQRLYGHRRWMKK